MRLVDAHVHLPQSDIPREMLAADARVMLLCSASTDEAETRLNIELAAKSGGVVRSFGGIHPSSAASAAPGFDPERFQSLLTGADGVGEIGLDPKYSPVARGGAQERLFLAQLEMAERLRRPVQVHTRDAERLCLDHLSTVGVQKVLLHWFEGEELLGEAASRGYYVSFGPALLYSKKLGRMAKRYPEELILTESDGPVSFGALQGAGGPSTVPSTIFRLAALRGGDFASTSMGVAANASVYLSEK